ncbi:MAG: hypothetical protein HY303_18470 [Candidatus Wallbacteria bacterium]|nr:hypothetical protein [Candidatus Wallbacteria bacterium]
MKELHLDGLPVPTLESLQQFVARAGLAILAAGKLSLPAVAEAVAGCPIRGSWWSHSAGKRIFNLSEALADSDAVLGCKLVAGKITFIHRDLWPAFWRIVSGGDSPAPCLAPGVRGLLDRVEREGRVRLDEPGVVSADGKALADSLLVAAASEHTPSGKHVTVFTRWRDAIPRAARCRGDEMSLDEARSTLLQRALCGALCAPEREVLRWFPWEAEATRRLLESWVREGKLKRAGGVLSVAGDWNSAREAAAK